MQEGEFYDSVARDDEEFARSSRLPTPPYRAASYYRDIAHDPYFRTLAIIRHHLKRASDFYMSEQAGAKNLDLFMMTPSISSPMGPGSDSEAVPIQFGDLHTYLVDSSQFGFEPLVLNGLDRVYCYLPSMRGEDPDDRHLNQFFHCEIEIAGTMDDLIPLAEGYIKALAKTLAALPNRVSNLSESPEASTRGINELIGLDSLPVIAFDEAWRVLDNGDARFCKQTQNGRVITGAGEMELMRRMDLHHPLWIRDYDRDTIPFYQKPDPANSDRCLNADLIFPQLTAEGFGGEVLGSGQRQDNPEEMEESLQRQGISMDPYAWYIDLRRMPGYRTTAGFGLGIERFLAWALGKKSIRDVALYPRLKNVTTIP